MAVLMTSNATNNLLTQFLYLITDILQDFFVFLIRRAEGGGKKMDSTIISYLEKGIFPYNGLLFCR